MNSPEPHHLRAGRYTRFLPHVRVEGRPYFVTFRLEGTLPQTVLRQFQAEREEIFAKAAQQGNPLSWQERRRLFELYSAKIERYLDAGNGECWLKEPRLAELVCNALRFFDAAAEDLSAGMPELRSPGFPAGPAGKPELRIPVRPAGKPGLRARYELTAWVVMPNHVHVIVRPTGNHTLDSLLQSWKGFTAREANKLMARTAQSFWGREYYDHVIFDDGEKAALTRYIYDNPVKAGLCARWEDWPWSSAHPRWRAGWKAGAT